MRALIGSIRAILALVFASRRYYEKHRPEETEHGYYGGGIL